VDTDLDHTGNVGKRGRWLAVLALVILVLVWGYNWVVMKVGLGYSQPFTFAALRTFLGALALFLLLLVLRRPVRPRALGATTVLGLLQTTGSVGLAMWALERGGAGKTSILVYTMPFWLLLMAWVFLSERLRRIQWVAVALAFLGLMLVLSPWRLSGGFSDLLAVGAAVCWAASAVVAKVLRKRHKVDLLSLTAWQMLLGAIPLVLVALLAWSGQAVWSRDFLGALAYNVILANAVGWLLWLFMLHTLRAGTAGLGTLAVPVVGVTSAWIQLGERPDAGEALGMAAIVGALLLLALREILAKPGGRDPRSGQHPLSLDQGAHRVEDVRDDCKR
jgi:drug/metabolite transporter (DMT)-like permease